jgi:hypothetical protein
MSKRDYKKFQVFKKYQCIDRGLNFEFNIKEHFRPKNFKAKNTSEYVLYFYINIVII